MDLASGLSAAAPLDCCQAIENVTSCLLKSGKRYSNGPRLHKLPQFFNCIAG